jgi:hypothetical protein
VPVQVGVDVTRDERVDPVARLPFLRGAHQK